MSEHFIRLGMTDDMRQQIEAWRAKQLQETGSIPSFSEAVRLLIAQSLSHG